MVIFKDTNGSLKKVKEIGFNLEEEMQNLVGKNLDTIFGLEFVRHEFLLDNLRIDTLAFNKENNSFVIIEYKNKQNFSVIDQGYAYLSLMLNNKADFILEYNEQTNSNLKKTDIDWSQSRVMFVSPSFSKYQLQAINFKDLPFELWEISRYDNNLIQMSKIKTSETSESIKKVSKDIATNIVDKEVKVYSEEDHLQNMPEKIKSLYEELKNQIYTIDNKIELEPKKMYLAFKSNSNFVDVVLKKSKIKIHLNLKKGQLKSSSELVRDVSNIGHWGNGDYEVQLSNAEDLPVVLSLIKQSYDLNN